MVSSQDDTFPGLSALVGLGYHTTPEKFISYIELRASDTHISLLTGEVLAAMGYLVTTPSGDPHHDLEGWKDGRTIFAKIYRDTSIDEMNLRLLEPQDGLDASESIIIIGSNVTIPADIDLDHRQSTRLIPLEEFYDLVIGALTKLDVEIPTAPGEGALSPARTRSSDQDLGLDERRLFRITPPRLDFLYSLAGTDVPFATWRSAFVNNGQLHHAARIYLQVRRDTEILTRGISDIDVAAYDPSAVTPPALYASATVLATVGRRVSELRRLEADFAAVFDAAIPTALRRPDSAFGQFGGPRSQYHEWLARWVDHAWLWSVLTGTVQASGTESVRHLPEVGWSTAKRFEQAGAGTIGALSDATPTALGQMGGLDEQVGARLHRHIQAVLQADDRITLPASLRDECQPDRERFDDPRETLAPAERFIARAGREADALERIGAVSFDSTPVDAAFAGDIRGRCLWCCQMNPDVTAEEDPLATLADALERLAVVTREQVDTVDRAEADSLAAVGSPPPIPREEIQTADSIPSILDHITALIADIESYVLALEGHVDFRTGDELVATLPARTDGISALSTEEMQGALDRFGTALCNPVADPDTWGPAQATHNDHIARYLQILDMVCATVEAHHGLAVGPFLDPVTVLAPRVPAGDGIGQELSEVGAFVEHVHSSGDQFGRILAVEFGETPLDSTLPDDVRDQCLHALHADAGRESSTDVTAVADALDRLADAVTAWGPITDRLGPAWRDTATAPHGVALGSISDTNSLSALAEQLGQTAQGYEQAVENYRTALEIRTQVASLAEEVQSRGEPSQAFAPGIQAARDRLDASLETDAVSPAQVGSLAADVTRFIDVSREAVDFADAHPEWGIQRLVSRLTSAGEQLGSESGPDSLDTLAGTVGRLQTLEAPLTDILSTSFDNTPMDAAVPEMVRDHCLQLCFESSESPTGIPHDELTAAVARLATAARQVQGANEQITAAVGTAIAVPVTTIDGVLRETTSFEATTESIAGLATTYETLVEACTGLQAVLHRGSDIHESLRTHEHPASDTIASGVDAAITGFDPEATTFEDLATSATRFATALDVYIDLVEQGMWLLDHHPETLHGELAELYAALGAAIPAVTNRSAESDGSIEIAAGIVEFIDRVGPLHPLVDFEASLTAIEHAVRTGDLEPVEAIERDIQQVGTTPWQESDLLHFEWEAFEHLIAKLYTAEGKTATVTQGTHDMGVDVWADDGAIAVQVKRFAPGNTVGRQSLQELESHLLHGAKQVVVVTSSDFATTARSYARENPQIELVNGAELVRRLSRTNIPPPRAD